MSKTTLVLLFACALSLLSKAARADIVVVVSAGNPNVPSKFQIKNIFLGLQNQFADGTRAKPVDQSDERPIRNDFYMQLSGRDESEMKAYWAGLIFTGDASPPRSVRDDGEVKKFIQENPGGIGYIDDKSVDASVKAVLTIK
jgi:ABC-type phosphate transport system substrate-binding protein